MLLRQSVKSALLAVALIIFAMAATGAPAYGTQLPDVEPLLYFNDSQSHAILSNGDATNPSVMATDVWRPGALSPDGQWIGYVARDPETEHLSIRLLTIDGATSRTLVDDSSVMPVHVSFTPNGRSVLAASSVLGTEGWHPEIWRISIATGDHTLVKSYPPGAAVHRAEYTADGQYIVLSMYDDDSEGDPIIRVISPSGTTIRDLDLSSLFWPYYATTSPDPDFIAFTAGSTEESLGSAYTAELDGTNVDKVTEGDDGSLPSAFTPDGHNLVGSRNGIPPEREWDYDLFSVSSAGGSAQTLVVGEDHDRLEWPTYRQPSTMITYNDFLAKSFRPILAFDSSEKWRPLNVRTFLEEVNSSELPIHQACEPSGSSTQCSFTTGYNTLRDYRSADAYLDIAGSGDESNFSSPYSACHADGLRDCNSGPASVFYYHVVPASSGSYTYLDYWIFYRYNDTPDALFGGFTHEADWEGITLAIDPEDPSTFVYAQFAQHEHRYNYLRDVLECDGGGANSCGSSTAPAGRRIVGYVANNSHATYPTSCDEELEWDCMQTNSALYEGGHDGDRAWGRNGDPGGVQRVPADGQWALGVGHGNWVDWPGDWGVQEDVDSPGRQGRYTAPYTGWDCATTTCPQPKSNVGGRALTRSSKQSRISNCEDWFGAAVTLALCSPEPLRKGIARARLGEKGHVRFRAGGSGRRQASAPGIAQLVGRPLAPNQSLRIDTRSGAGEAILLVRGRCGRKFVQARTGGPVAMGRTADVTLNCAGTNARFTVRTAGRHLELSGKSIARPDPVPGASRPAARVVPRVLSVTHTKRGLAVKIDPHGTRSRVVFRASRHGKPLTKVRRRGSRPFVALLRGGAVRKAAYVTITAWKHGRSRRMVVRLPGRRFLR